MTNSYDIVHTVKFIETPLSNHNLILVGTNFNLDNRSKVQKSKVGFASLSFYHSEAKWDDLNEELAAFDWTSFSDQSPTEFLEILKEELLMISMKHI